MLISLKFSFEYVMKLSQCNDKDSKGCNFAAVLHKFIFVCQNCTYLNSSQHTTCFHPAHFLTRAWRNMSLFFFYQPQQRHLFRCILFEKKRLGPNNKSLVKMPLKTPWVFVPFIKTSCDRWQRPVWCTRLKRLFIKFIPVLWLKRKRPWHLMPGQPAIMRFGLNLGQVNTEWPL